MSKKTKQLTVNAMMAAMCAVLGYLSLDFGNLKITFETLPILLSAMMFGPLDGMVAGGLGTLIYQLLRYGVSVTTPLWMLPYILCGLAAGWYARRESFSLTSRQIMVTVVLCEFMVTILNTGVLYLDSKIYGYYSAVFIFGSLLPRLALCIGKGMVFGAVMPGIIRPVKRSLQ